MNETFLNLPSDEQAAASGKNADDKADDGDSPQRADKAAINAPHDNLVASGQAGSGSKLTRFLAALGIGRAGDLVHDGINNANSAANAARNGDSGAPVSQDGPAVAHELTAEEKALVSNIFHLQDVRVEDLMVPRAEIKAIEMETTLAELLSAFETSGHSRMPVFAETLDDPRGMIHIRDLLSHVTRMSGSVTAKSGKNKSSRKRINFAAPISKLNLTRKILFVPPSMMAADLMARMQAARTQIALVIDEYGGTDGLVSLEDIVEVIVGDIEDEHDDDKDHIKKLGPGHLLCDARAEIDDLVEALENGFDVGEHGEDADTIGGVIFSLLGRVPVNGEIIEAFGYEFHIKSADPRRIKSVEIIKGKKKVPLRRK